MTLSIKSILACLIILAMASNIHTREIKPVERSKELVASTGKNIVLGTGVELSQLPIITHSLTSTTLHVGVYIQSGKQCDFTLSFGTVKSVNIGTVKQLTYNRLALIWFKQTNVDTRTVSILDMDYCAVNVNLDSDLSPSDILVVVPFDNGFDVITSKNNRASYDNDGKLIGQPKSFPINSFSFDISAASRATSIKGFFVVDYSNAALNLIKEDGTPNKQLLTFSAGVFSNSEQSLYSICWFDTEVVVKCFQYDEDGNEKWNNKVTLTFGGALDMKNLAGGGLVFVALNPDGNQFSFVEMGPTQPNTWNYVGQQQFKAVRLTAYSKEERTIVLVCDSYLTEQGADEEVAASQKYVLAP